MFEFDVKNVMEEGRRGPAWVWGSDIQVFLYLSIYIDKYKNAHIF